MSKYNCTIEVLMFIMVIIELVELVLVRVANKIKSTPDPVS